MKKEPKQVTITGKWESFDDKTPLGSNVFRITWVDETVILTVGLLDPEYFIPGRMKKDEQPPIRILGRFQFGKSNLLRLKEEVDNSVEKMKEMGLLK